VPYRGPVSLPTCSELHTKCVEHADVILTQHGATAGNTAHTSINTSGPTLEVIMTPVRPHLAPWLLVALTACVVVGVQSQRNIGTFVLFTDIHFDPYFGNATWGKIPPINPLNAVVANIHVAVVSHCMCSLSRMGSATCRSS
jgi:hypothetical protein